MLPPGEELYPFPSKRAKEIFYQLVNSKETSWEGASLMGIQSGEYYQYKFLKEKYPEKF